MSCSCDSPVCSNWVCKLLGEYRIVHRVVSELAKDHQIETIDELLQWVEGECEILVK